MICVIRRTNIPFPFPWIFTHLKHNAETQKHQIITAWKTNDVYGWRKNREWNEVFWFEVGMGKQVVLGIFFLDFFKIVIVGTGMGALQVVLIYETTPNKIKIKNTKLID